MTDHSAVHVTLKVRHLERLLRKAHEDHRKSETRTGAQDANWERWYAQYIINRLAVEDSSDESFDPGSTSNSIAESGEILPPGAMLKVRDLERLLREAYENHQKSETQNGAQDANWERWYAQYIIDRLAVEDSADKLFDLGSTSNLITESDDVLLLDR